MTASSTPARLPMHEKFGYSLGDAASNLVFQLAINFITRFYTDVAFIDPLHVGFILLAVRLLDAITDPVMGAIADRTNTRWGQFRPYLLWIAVPFGLSAVLAFSIPGLQESGKVLYALFTYAGLMIAYTAINIPYSAMAASMTADPQERTALQSWRFAGGQTGNLIVSAMTLPLVGLLGGGNEELGWRYAAILYAVLAVIMFVACFVLTRERIHVEPAERSTTLLPDLAALIRNDQWWALSFLQLFLLIVVVMRATVTFYFVDEMYGAERPEDSGYIVTAFFTLGAIGAIVGSLQANRVSNPHGWRETLGLGGLQVGLTAVFYLIGWVDLEMALVACLAVGLAVGLSDLIGRRFGRIGSLTSLFIAQGLGHFALYAVGGSGFLLSLGLFVGILTLNQVAVPIVWTLMTDSVDYGEMKTGKRLAGLTFSANLFALKIGVALGGAGAAWTLSYYGYDAAAEVQSERTLTGILMAFALVPGAFCLITALISSQMKLSRKRMRSVQQALGRLHAGEADTPSAR